MRRRLAVALGAGLLATFTLTGWAQVAGPARHVGSFSWRMDDPHFGGLSALEVGPDGRSFVALSDRGYRTEGRLKREGGRVTGVEAAPMRALGGQRKGNDLRNDSEGLAIARDGTEWVSYEFHQHVREVRPDRKMPPLPRHRWFKRLPQNGGLEALAIDGRGRLITLAERAIDAQGRVPVFRFEGGAWRVVRYIDRRDRFVPVGADVGPDGMLYLLERRFTGLGFRSQVRRFDPDAPDTPPELLLRSGTGAHDNLEGLAVWRDGAGHIRLTMISDDNFRFFQTTEIVEYLLAE